MGYWRIRLFALVIAGISVGLVYINWQDLLNEGRYSFKLAALAPLGVVFGAYLFFFPQKIGRPETVLDKLVAMLLLAIGAAAGAYNWYLMDPHHFDELIALLSSTF